MVKEIVFTSIVPSPEIKLAGWHGVCYRSRFQWQCRRSWECSRIP